jgi:hypothetical protein
MYEGAALLAQRATSKPLKVDQAIYVHADRLITDLAR